MFYLILNANKRKIVMQISNIHLVPKMYFKLEITFFFSKFDFENIVKNSNFLCFFFQQNEGFNFLIYFDNTL